MGICHFLKFGLATGSVVLLSSTAHADCAEDAVTLRGGFGQAQFNVRVADEPSERAQGLMFVEQMGPMEGMLFVFETPRSVSFWMRNTLIPLDMIFVDEMGIVRSIQAMAQPLDETPIFGGDDIQFVLEVNGGMAERLGLEVGNEMQHPSFGDNAIWACPLD